MPKPKRTPEEIEAVKNEILAHAIQLLIQEGYRGFSMRKLAARLGITAKTIYNYFKNKDELYLMVLTKGFERLYKQCRSIYQAQNKSLDRIDGMIRAYLDFGLEETNFYNLMFTWQIPKYKDYLGTEMEPAARKELEATRKVDDLFIRAIKECEDTGMPISEEEARFLMITFWTQLHGYIAGYHNTVLEYMHEDPISLKERILTLMKENFRIYLNRLKHAKDQKA